MDLAGDDKKLSSGWTPISPSSLQPRIVLGLLLIGSFIGIWIAHWGEIFLLRGILWLVIVSLGTLVGGLYWWLILFDETTFEDITTGSYIKTRWQQLETTCVWVVALTGTLYFVVTDTPFGFGRPTLEIAFISFLLPWFGIRYSDSESSNRTRAALRNALLLLGLASLSGVAWIETGPNLVDWIVRLVHLGSFSLWIGGAAWHNFIVLPTVATLPTAATSLKSQARTFRRHLPLVIPLLFLTGIYQTNQLVGLQPSTLWSSSIGRFVGLKVLILIGLTVLVLVTLGRNS